MTVDGGGTLQTYCIDIHNPTQSRTQVPGDALERHVAGRQQRDAGKIRWILQNSYPQVNDLAALAARPDAGRADREDRGGRHPGRDLALLGPGATSTPSTRRPRSSPTTWRRSAQNLAEPKASLTLDPPAVSGQSGERLGPVTVHTNADSVDGRPRRPTRPPAASRSSTRTARPSPPRPTAASCSSTCPRAPPTARPR